MKLFSLIVLVSVLQSFTTLHAQHEKVLLSGSKMTFVELIQKIEEQTSYQFVYQNEHVKNVSIENVDYDQESVEDVLKDIFLKTELTYRLVGNNIIIMLGDEKPEETPSTVVQAQPATIKGNVVDAKTKETLIGVNIIVKGTTIGVVTDIDGNFELNYSGSEKMLLISYIGYQSIEVAWEPNKELSLSLAPSTEDLDEVIVVGFGIQKKVNLTGSVATVNASQIKDRNVTSISASLQGSVPGMTIIQSSGQPGANNGSIRIRGVGTLNNSNPLILIDGVEGDMNSLDVNEIESFSVLKDAASASIYGSKAGNGVILITTKRGRSGEFTVNYSSNFGWQTPNQVPEMLSSADHATLFNRALSYDDEEPRWTEKEIQKFRDGSDPYNYPNTDWISMLFIGSGFQHTHNLNISGGNDKATYMSSIGYQDQKGIIDHSGSKKLNIRTNIDYKLSNKLRATLNMAYVNSKVMEPTQPFGGGQEAVFFNIYGMAPWIPYKNEDGTYGTVAYGNPIAWMDIGSTTNKIHHTFTNIASLSYDIIDGMVLKAQASYRANLDRSKEFRKDIQYSPNMYQGPNSLRLNNSETSMITSDITLDYDKMIGRHSISALAGFHTEEWKYQTTYAYRQNFPNNDMTDINAGSPDGQVNSGYSRENAMISWFGRINYNFSGKYLFEANIRADASSRFAESNRWGAFPSFSTAWRISEEEFMDEIRNILPNMKIRGSWGMLGNQYTLNKDGGTDYYPALPTISLGYNYAFGDKVYPGAFQGNAKLETISWEDTRNWGIGVDFNIKETIDVSLDYYNRLTTGILMSVEAPSTFGRSGYIDNIGKVENAGFEATINWNKTYNDFTVNVGGNFSYNKNKILNLGNEERIISGLTIKQVNSPINSFFGYVSEGLFQSQEEIDNWAKYKMAAHKVLPGDIKYKDINGDGEITSADRVPLGSTDPKYTFGLNLSVAWKGISVLANFQGVAGVSSYLYSTGHFSGDNTASVIWLDSWSPENTDAKYPRVSYGNSGISKPLTIYSDFWEQDASYLRLKNLQIGYTFTETITDYLNLKNVRIYYSGTNLFTITNFLEGWDPETPWGRGGSYPQVSVHSFGINITF